MISLIMISVVLLSVGSTFAADDNATDVVAIDDETSVDNEVLEVSDDSQVLSDNESVAATSVVVTKDNLNEYVSSSGTINENLTADELIFEGEFDNLNLSVDRPLIITGKNAVLNNPFIDLGANNITFQGFTITQTKHINALFVGGLEENPISDVTLSNLTIDFTDIGEAPENIAIEAINVNNFKLFDSVINYIGATNGSYINNALSVKNSNGTIIAGNKFKISLISVPVNWVEEPAGSWNYVSYPMSEGIVIDSSNDVVFDSNDVEVNYSNYSGAYDTIYTIDFKNSNNAIITNNNITSNGYTYIYGIILSGDDFIIRSNNINSTGQYYANGIDIEGPASGVVENNVIDVNAPNLAYGIYSGMNGKDVKANYTGNNITGSAYLAMGFSLGDVESNIVNNSVILEGNYTTGIAVKGTVADIDGNYIYLTSSEQGNESIWETFGVEAAGIKIVGATAQIDNNVVATPGKGVSVTGNTSSVSMTNNFINVVGNIDKDEYAIYVSNANLIEIKNNTVDYQGTTNGTGINNAIYIYNVEDPAIVSNNFIIELVSAPVNWVEEPAGSWNYVSYPITEGIVIDSSKDLLFSENNVQVTFGDVVGTYDTIYAIDVKNSDYAIISNNNITSNGYTYIYGIIISGDSFVISDNNINSTGQYYANGIDIEGPASGVVLNNVIDVNAPNLAYAIYSGMNNQNVSANYAGNNITGSAYLAMGFSLGDIESDIINNSIMIKGNYTTGIAVKGTVADIDGNYIYLTSSEEGNVSIWETFGVEAAGIKVVGATAQIDNNVVATPGKGVSVTGNTSSVSMTNNFINVVGNLDKDAYAIYVVDANRSAINNNTIDYQGTTNGTGINNAVYISNVENPNLLLNNFTIELVSAPVNWVEEPAGSWNYVSYPVTEGIVIDSSKDLLFRGNNVQVTFGDVVGTYDTIYAIDVKNSDYARIIDNNITANGYTYMYGILISGDSFVISGNNINSTGQYYANGIDIEGPASGVVENNVIDVNAPNLAYGIYSGMNGKDVKANYTGNNITGSAYLAMGFSLGDVESDLINNSVILEGNYTTGIAVKGTVADIDGNRILLTSSEEGNESIWETFGVEAAGIKVVGATAQIDNNVVATPGKGVSVTGNTSSVSMTNNFINVVGNLDKDAYAIYVVDANRSAINSNDIDYQGTTNGTGINNAVYISNVENPNVILNNFTIELVSAPVNWVEEPAGSWNYVSYPITEGIVIDSSKDLLFRGNNVQVTLGDAFGLYDTIYSVDIKNSDNAVISGNNIVSEGNSYIYGIIITGDGFVIDDNNISSTGQYYADGIDIEGPATGVVENNNIDVVAPNLAYGIYSGMNGKDVKANYTGNKISGSAYFAMGFSLGDIESVLKDNEVTLGGNYTTGIGFNGGKLVADGNKIALNPSNNGNESIWETFGVETVGVKVLKGDATIVNNDIRTNGEYTVNATKTNSSVHDNYLLSDALKGDSSVAFEGDAEVYNNTPLYKSIISALDVEMEENDGSLYVVILKDENNNYVVNETVVVKVGENNLTGVTDDKGVATFVLNLTEGNYTAVASFEGSGNYMPISTESTITVLKQMVDAEVNVTIPTNVKAGENATVDVALPEDATGNVTVKVNGEEVATVPVENGTASVALENMSLGANAVEVNYSGDDKYAPVTKTAAIAGDKIDTILTVDAKFSRVANDFNAGERGDYFYAVLTDVNGNILVNKTVQVAVNGPIYNVTTDDKGQAGVKVNLANANTYTYALEFQGDEKYNAAPLASSKLTLTAKKTSISASDKSFKKSAKTKSYSVTLKTSKNPYDGKTYLSAGKKITLKVNGKTYTAKTNAKGVAKFTLKLTKKAKYIAKIKFAGDKTYKASSKTVKITLK